MLGGPLAAALRSAAGSWTPVFLLAAAMDVLTALLALFELKAMRQAWAAADAPSEEVRGPAASAPSWAGASSTGWSAGRSWNFAELVPLKDCLGHDHLVGVAVEIL